MPARRFATLSRGVLLLLVALIAFEVVTRFDDWARFGTPVTARATSLDDLFVRDSVGAHARPGQWYRGFRIDDEGFRLLDAAPPRAGALTIVTGASETFGLYESPGQEWPAQLADSLRTRCGTSAVQVRNAAFAGMSLPTVDQDVRLRLAPLRPRVIVYYPTPMQYLEDRLPRATPPVDGAPAAVPTARSRALLRIRDAVKGAMPAVALDAFRAWSTARSRAGRPADWLFTSPPADRLERFRHDLDSLVTTIRAVGATPVLVVHANRFGRPHTGDAAWLAAWTRFYPRATGETLLAVDRAAAEITLEVGRARGAPVVDVRGALAAAGPMAFADFSHFTNLGAGLTAGHVARAIDQVACER
jgi:hypothetical protein